jgi:nucleotide-binding universal stress UspA family protein
MTDLRRILVPTDFTETSDRALDWAVGVAAKVGGHITLLHAYEIPIIGFPDGAVIATPEMASRLADASRAALDATVKRLADRGVAVDSLLREGVVWEEINAVADSIQADLIVIGTHGRRGLARALLGSVAENVVRTATRPVVTIRDTHGHDETSA